MKLDTSMLATIFIIAIAIVISQWLSNRFFALAPKEEIVKRTNTGNPVNDFLDNYS